MSVAHRFRVNFVPPHVCGLREERKEFVKNRYFYITYKKKLCYCMLRYCEKGEWLVCRIVCPGR